MKHWVRSRFGKDADRLITADGKIVPASERRGENECAYMPALLEDGKKLNVCYKCGKPYAGARRVCDRKVEKMQEKRAAEEAAKDE